MTRMMEVALERLAAEPEDTQKLWAARIINALRGCPNGLEPGAFVPEDWGEGDEIWEAILGDETLAAEFVEAAGIGRECDESEGDRMSLDEFLERADREDAEDGAEEAASPPAAGESTPAPAKAAA